jgi:hypothetical protein
MSLGPACICVAVLLTPKRLMMTMSALLRPFLQRRFRRHCGCWVMVLRDQRTDGSQLLFAGEEEEDYDDGCYFCCCYYHHPPFDDMCVAVRTGTSPHDDRHRRRSRHNNCYFGNDKDGIGEDSTTTLMSLLGMQLKQQQRRCVEVVVAPSAIPTRESPQMMWKRGRDQGCKSVTR